MSGARQAQFRRDTRWNGTFLGAAALSLIALSAQAGGVHEIVQEARAFHPGEITIAAGDSLSFSNHDEFLHQIYFNSVGLNFDSDEQSPGQTVSVRFPASGRFNVRCHIHPKMNLAVTVR